MVREVDVMRLSVEGKILLSVSVLGGMLLVGLVLVCVAAYNKPVDRFDHPMPVSK
jgi:hypothetical protein